MARVRTKSGVVFGGFTLTLCEILTALCDVAGVWMGLPEDIVITSGSDGAHHPRSKHYTYQAIDIRSKNFPNAAAKERFVAQLRHRLGPRYTVLHESVGHPSEHFHVQPRMTWGASDPVDGGRS